MKTWTLKDEEIILKYYELEGAERVATRLNRSADSVKSKAARLRKKGKRFLKQEFV